MDASYFQLLKDYNARFGCFVTVLDGTPGATPGQRAEVVGAPLRGLRMAVKDCIDIRGVRGTWGSSVHRNRYAEDDAYVVDRLRTAGADLVATANLHEFAFGGTTQNPHYGSCRNAWQPDRVPGGSSGGSAVAVALGLCEAALGTDTGASVRLPGALNGVIGLRPTHGAVSASGVMPVSPPHDTVGVFAREIDVVRRVFHAIRSFDAQDPYSRIAPSRPAAERAPGHPPRLGIATALVDGCTPPIAAAFHRAVDILRDLRMTTCDLPSPRFAEVADHLSAIVIGDAAALHRERLAQHADEIGAAVHSRMARGVAMPAFEYIGHLRWLEAFRGFTRRTFDAVDFIIAPSVPVSPPLIEGSEDAVAVTKLVSRNCWLAPAAGLPAITVPCGLDDLGVPVGLQIVGPRWSDDALLDLAAAFLAVAPSIGTPPAFVATAR